jgi:hypothetical protein
MTELLCSISDLNYSNITKTNNLVEDDCPITFTIRCEFNTIGLFDLSVPNPGPYRVITPPKSSIAIPIFSDAFNEKDFPLSYGWTILAKPIVKLDWDEREVSIQSVLGITLNRMIDYHLQHGIDVGLFIDVKLRENHCLIDDGYYVDWKRRMLVLTNVRYTSTYRLIIIYNKLYMNDMLSMMYDK